MFSLRQRILNAPMTANYRKMVPYVRPYWVRAVMAVLITLPIGSFDALTAWILKPYMDVFWSKRACVTTRDFSRRRITTFTCT